MGEAEQLKSQIKATRITPHTSQTAQTAHNTHDAASNSVFKRLWGAKTPIVTPTPPSHTSHTSDSHDYNAEYRLKREKALNAEKKESTTTDNSNLSRRTSALGAPIGAVGPNSGKSSSSSSSSSARRGSDSESKISPGGKASVAPKAAPKLSEYEKQIMAGKGFFVFFF